MENTLPLIQSLFCKQGLDNRPRFGVIISTSHFLLLFFWLIFSQQPTFLAIIASVLTGVIFLSSKRRLKDAGLANYWVLLPALGFIVASIALISFDSSWLLLAFIPSLMTASYLISLPTRNNQQYTQGYAGPVDLLANATKSVHDRNKIEPSLHGSVEHLQLAEINHRANSTFQQPTNLKSVNLEQWFKDNILSIKHIKIIAPLCFSLVLILVVILITNDSAVAPEEVDLPSKVEQVTQSQTSTGELLNIVAMPDDFELASNEFDGIKLRWQADEIASQTLWDVLTAKGDKSCANLSFNNGSQYRVINVMVTNSDTYVATFSPLDTDKIIKDLAYKNTFTVCGYDFSLKGSQAAIGKNSYFGKWL